MYPGDFMTSYWRGKGVMVTMNYRLNVFGFLGSEALRGQDSETGATGNYGLLGMIVSLC